MKKNFIFKWVIGLSSLLVFASCSTGITGGNPLLPTNIPVTTSVPTTAGIPVTGPASTAIAAPLPTGTATPAPTSVAPTGTPNAGNTSTAAPAIPITGNNPSGFAISVRQVAQQVKPAIVQITNEQVQINRFNQTFNIPSGVGSGVIYDNQGHILTNNHVVSGAQNLLVTLPDGRSFPAKLVGADTQTDLAVVQISAPDLPVAQLGDSSQLQVGDWVVAIGNALALPGGPTVSVGVVSALGRSVQEPVDQSTGQAGPLLFDLIQTDAPINPGNSGGALVNLNGQVIGINTLVAGQAEPGVQAQGIGFAISMSTAKPIADEIVATGHVVHPFMGIQYQPLNASVAAQMGINETQGVLITDVVSGSPADDAGLQPDDIITAIDNQPLKQDSDLAEIINQHKPGDTVTLAVDRGGREVSLKLTLGTAPSS